MLLKRWAKVEFRKWQSPECFENWISVSIWIATWYHFTQFLFLRQKCEYFFSGQKWLSFPTILWNVNENDWSNFHCVQLCHCSNKHKNLDVKNFFKNQPNLCKKKVLFQRLRKFLEHLINWSPSKIGPIV